MVTIYMITILALVMGCSYAQLPIISNLTLVFPQPASCSLPSGCNLTDVVVGGLNIILDGGAINFDSYTGATINFDTGLSFNLDALVISGTRNTINIGAGSIVHVTSLAVNVGNKVVIEAANSGGGSGTTTGLYVSGDAFCFGSVVVGSGSVLEANSFIQSSGNLTANAGARIKAAVTIEAGAGAVLGSSSSSSSSSSPVNVIGVFSVNGVASVGYTTFQSAVTVRGDATTTANLTITAVTTVAQTLSSNSQSSIIVNANAAITTTGAITTAGYVAVAGIIQAATSYTQQPTSSSSSFLLLNGGAVISSSIELNGIVGGQGNLTGNVEGDAIMNIGNSPGTVTINGDWNPGSGSTFNLEIASMSEFDRLIVSGTATPNGVLNCIRIDGYTPSENTRFTFITAGSVSSGSFTVVRGSTFGDASKWTASKTSSSVIANYSSAFSVAVSGCFVFFCLLVSLL